MLKSLTLVLLTSCAGHLPLWAHEPSQPHPKEQDTSRLSFFENRLKQNAEDVLALNELGRLSLEEARHSGVHTDFNKAEAYFRQLLAVEPNNERGQLGLAYTLMGRHGFHEALDLARLACESRPDSSEAWALLGDVHFALGHYAEAEMCFQRLNQKQSNFAAKVRLAQIEEVRGRFDQALRLFSEASDEVVTDPGASAWCQTMIGDLYLNQGNEAAAEQAFTAARPNATDYADWRLSELHWQQGSRHEASHRAQDLHERRPNADAYALTLAQFLHQRGQSEKAEALYQATEKDILGEVANGDMGHVRPLIQSWLERNINLEQALTLAQRELNEVRGDLEAHELVGWALYKLGRTQEAVPYLEAALRPGLGTTRTLLRGGIVLYQSGARIKAAQLLRLGVQRGYPLDRQLQHDAEALLCSLQTNPQTLTADYIKSWSNN